MTLLKEVSVVPRITSFTFVLPFPAPEQQLCTAHALEKRLASWIVDHRTGDADVHEGELALSDGRVAFLILTEGASRTAPQVLRVTLSLEDIEHAHLIEVGDNLRALIGDDFGAMCTQAQAVAMTVCVYLWDVTFDRVLPRFKAPNGQAVEQRKYNKAGLIEQIKYKTEPVAGTSYQWGEGSIFEPHAEAPSLAGAKSIAHSEVLWQEAGESKKKPALMMFEQQYRLNMALTELAAIQGNLHRLGFAEDPFMCKPKLRKPKTKDFFNLVRTEGIDAAMARARWWDGGLATRDWWKSREPTWWNPTEVWDECVLDLPAIGRLIASGFSEE